MRTSKRLQANHAKPDCNNNAEKIKKKKHAEHFAKPDCKTQGPECKPLISEGPISASYHIRGLGQVEFEFRALVHRGIGIFSDSIPVWFQYDNYTAYRNGWQNLSIAYLDFGSPHFY